MDVSPVSEDDKTTLIRHLMSYNFASVNGKYPISLRAETAAMFILLGFLYGVDTLKSVILTLATIDRFLTPEKAVLLSRLEEEYQCGRWGRVEWAHDLNQHDLQSRLAAVVLFVYFNSQSMKVQEKNKP